MGTSAAAATPVAAWTAGRMRAEPAATGSAAAGSAAEGLAAEGLAAVGSAAAGSAAADCSEAAVAGVGWAVEG